MKKLIGLLGAAGLLIPSAAMAGNIGSQTGSSAMRATGSSTTYTTVTVDSSIDRVNTIGVAGANYGTSFDFAAENATVGYRHGTYDYDQTTGSAAGNVDGEVAGAYGGIVRDETNVYADGEATGDVTVSTEYTPGEAATAGKGCFKSFCLVEPQDATPEVTTVVTEGEVAFEGEAGYDDSTLTGAGGYLEAEGSIDGTYDDSNIAFSDGTGGEFFLNGAASGSVDTYTNGYIGSLYETGNTTTSVIVNTDASSTNRGFESSSFTNSDWN